MDFTSLLKVPLFVALDVDDQREALQLAEKVVPYVGGFKLGPRLTLRYGAEFIKKMAALAPVFVDCKYYDIPNTVEHSLRATFDAGASFATIHAGAGVENLKHQAGVEKELNRERPFKILAVTVLTSYSQNNLPSNWKNQPVAAHVNDLFQDARMAGLSGFVCSAEEVGILRPQDKQAFLLVPGIRLPEDQKSDQQRTMGPREALTLGASALVVGRPIVDAQDPVAAAKKFFELIRSK